LVTLCMRVELAHCTDLTLPDSHPKLTASRFAKCVPVTFGQPVALSVGRLGRR
jgi:hypothetical protein